MRYVNGEVLFKSYDEACLHQLVLKDHFMSMYNCVICGINFATIDPYCADYGVTCRVCAKTMNLSENDNYRPDLDGPAEDDQLFEPYDDSNEYGR